MSSAQTCSSDCFDCSARIFAQLRPAHPYYPVIQPYRIRQNELEFVTRLLLESRASNMHTMFSENGLFIQNYLFIENKCSYYGFFLLVVLRCDGEKCILGHWGNEPPGPALSPGVLQLQANACYLHFCQVRTVSKVVEPKIFAASSS